MVRGNIEVTDFVDLILRFDHLAKVEGSLIISNSANLMRVDAYSLRVITESFKMEKLQSLGLIETPNLVTVKNLDWQILPLLSQVSLDSLKDVQSVIISDTSLTTISKFAGTNLHDLVIQNNRFMELVNFDTEDVRNSLQITGNARNVVVKLGELKLAHNISVSNVRDLNMTKLRKVERSMSVVENSFTEVAFPSLTEIGGLLRLADNREAKEANFDSVVDIGGGVLIQDNNELHDISFLPQLRSIGGALELTGNIARTEWESLKMVKGSIHLQSTNSEFDCNKWSNGPIRNTLRGGEIECSVSSFEPSPTSSPGSQNVEHASQSAQRKVCEWLFGLCIAVIFLSF